MRGQYVWACNIYWPYTERGPNNVLKPTEMYMEDDHTVSYIDENDKPTGRCRKASGVSIYETEEECVKGYNDKWNVCASRVEALKNELDEHIKRIEL